MYVKLFHKAIDEILLDESDVDCVILVVTRDEMRNMFREKFDLRDEQSHGRALNHLHSLYTDCFCLSRLRALGLI